MDVQVSLMSHSRTDAQRPRSLSLASAAQILSMYSRNRPDRTSDHDNAWLSKVASHACGDACAHDAVAIICVTRI